MSDTPLTDALEQTPLFRHRKLNLVVGEALLHARNLERKLTEALRGRCQCDGCGKTVNNAWRDSDGFHCLTCLAKQRDELEQQLTAASNIAVTANSEAARYLKERNKAKEHLEFLKSKGLTVGLLMSSDCPEGKLAYVIESESELCNLKLIHRVIDAERESDEAKAAVAMASKALTDSEYGWRTKLAAAEAKVLRLREAGNKLAHYVAAARKGDSPLIQKWLIESIDEALEAWKVLAAERQTNDQAHRQPPGGNGGAERKA